MLKKIILIIICTLLTGCKSSPDYEEISFASWGSVTEVKILKKIINDFENDNPKIKINFIHIPQNYFQKIHLLYASNSEPDIIFINNLYLPIYETKLEDLSKNVDINAYFPQAIEGLSYNNKLLAIPRDISNLVLYINLDLIDLPDENWTIDELLTSAQKISDKNIFGISFEEDFYWMSPYTAYFNEHIFDCPKSLKFYKNLKDIYNIAPTKSQVGSSTLAQMFLDEKIGMYLSGRWMYPIISEKANFDWAVINFPYGEGKQYLDTSGWAISKNSKHKNSALKFIKYLSNEKSSDYFLATGLIIPARINSAEKICNGKHNEKIFIDVIKHSKGNVVDKNYKKLIDKFNIKHFN